MIQLPDTSAIHRLLRRARVRIRIQGALEGATTATVIAAAAAAISIFMVRTEAVAPEAGIWLLGACGAAIALGAALGATRRLDDEHVARRIDRASSLADRLSTAIAFARTFAAKRPADGDVTDEMMAAAIKDGVRAAPRANLRAATPFAVPRDLRAAIGFLAVSALAAGLALPSTTPVAAVFRAAPDHAPPGATIAISGRNLGAIAPAGAQVALGTAAKSRALAITDWTPDSIQVTLPRDAALGDQKLLVFGARGARIGAVDLTVVDPRDPRYHKDDSVVLDPDERAYVKAILAELHDAAQRDKVPELDDFAKQIEQLLSQAEKGEITKEQLLDALQKAEAALQKDAEPNQAEVDKKLADMGKELAQDPLTKDLGDALQKQDLEKAQQELEKLADKLDKKELDKKQEQELAQKLDDVAKQMAKQDTQEQKQDQQKQQQVQKQIEDLQKQQQAAKTDQQKQELQARLDEKQRELQKLQHDQQEKQQSAQRRALQRLQKDVQKAAEDMQQKQEKDGQQKDGQQQDGQPDGQQQDGEQQASRSLHDAARETGRVDQDRRKQATQKKMSSQMDDLREAMRRAKQKGNKGPQDPFNRNGKNSDFAQRARGGQGQGGQGWKPGQGGHGQQNGQNGQQNGQGGDQGGNDWGTGHDDNLTGDPTQTSGHDKDQDLQGVQGGQGGSTRETILSAAQKGFASVGYKTVYANYERVIEEVMHTEKLPSSYKYYVERYFAKIHPRIVATQGDQ